MKQQWFRGWRGIAAFVIGITVICAAFLVYLRQPRYTAAQKGYFLALESGCFGCHGEGGTQGIPNPGAPEKAVPSWDGGTAMMYVYEEKEIEEWIRYGAPKRKWQDGRKPSELRKKDNSGDMSAQSVKAPLLMMPAYEEILSDKDMYHLGEYFKAVAVFEAPEGMAAAGYRIARESGCFGCHGPGGSAGVANPGSFKGYIPPWEGEDYKDLVRSDAELREWIAEGGIGRFRSNPIARYFTARQVIDMPPFKDVLSPSQVDTLVSYIGWLNKK